VTERACERGRERERESARERERQRDRKREREREKILFSTFLSMFALSQKVAGKAFRTESDGE